MIMTLILWAIDHITGGDCFHRDGDKSPYKPKTFHMFVIHSPWCLLMASQLVCLCGWWTNDDIGGW